MGLGFTNNDDVRLSSKQTTYGFGECGFAGSDCKEYEHCEDGQCIANTPVYGNKIVDLEGGCDDGKCVDDVNGIRLETYSNAHFLVY